MDAWLLSCENRKIANRNLLVVLLLALLGNITIRTTPCEQRRNIERFRLNRVSGQSFRPVLCEWSPCLFPFFFTGQLGIIEKKFEIIRSQVYSSATCLLASPLSNRKVHNRELQERRRWQQQKRHHSKVFAFFEVCRNYYNWTHFDCQMLLYSPGIEILETEHDLRRGKKSSVAVLCLRLFPSSTNVSSGIFILQSCSDGKGCCTCKVVVLPIKLFAFRRHRC